VLHPRHHIHTVQIDTGVHVEYRIGKYNNTFPMQMIACRCDSVGCAERLVLHGEVRLHIVPLADIGELLPNVCAEIGAEYEDAFVQPLWQHTDECLYDAFHHAFA
jgi:hypothetical protein